MPPPAVLFASIVFGLLGFVGFNHGRRRQSWKPLTIGLALMVFPYFVSATWLLYLIGVGLCAALFYFWRE